MSRFRTPWPWEPGAEPDPNEPRSGVRFEAYYGLRVLKNYRCWHHNQPLIEVVSSEEGTYWKCGKCPGRIPVRPGVSL